VTACGDSAARTLVDDDQEPDVGAQRGRHFAPALVNVIRDLDSSTGTWDDGGTGQ
jgi:hypothetical protein